MPRLSLWSVIAVVLGSCIGLLVPAFGADQKPLVINPTTGKQEQLQAGNRLTLPDASGDLLTVDTGVQAAARVLSAPTLSGNDTWMVLAEAQTVTGAKTFSALLSTSAGQTNTGTVQATFNGGLKVGGSPTAFTGAGLELAYNGSIASMLAIDRAGPTFKQMDFNGDNLRFLAFSVPALTISAAGVVNVPTTTEASAVGTAALTVAGGAGVAKRSFLGTIGATFKGNVLAGVQDATAAVAGQVGEVLSGNQSTYTNMAATATYGQVTSVSLTAGDWDVVGFFTLSANGATLTATANTIATISTTTASAAGTTEGLGDIGYISEVINGASGRASVTLHKRVNISATTSYFLNAQATYTAGTPQAVGSLIATRVR